MELERKKKWACPHCPKAFHTKQKVQKHAINHNDTNAQVKCEICKKTLKNPGRLFIHVRDVHSDKPKPSCLVCQKEYTTRENLRVHVKNMHTTAPRTRHPCTWPGCDKTFLRAGDAGKHFKREHVQNPVRFRCALCDKEFKDQGNLRRHIIAAHTMEKAHVCSTCGKRFKAADILKYHMTTHQEKSTLPVLVCESCPRTFLHPSSLWSHVSRIHRKVTYPCNLCDVILKSANGLAYHVATRHVIANEPPHSCDRCEYKTWTKLRLTMHMRRVHERVRSKECYFCGKRFFNFSELVRHCSVMHTLEG
ncbi:Zinc finger protein 62 [Folsomia candida]|uniref:Zinc finger protein 62 n=1 Tax=Folsomia candida TaxID=158441 RepID=A0A226D9I2_FOLCA|nr:Zinc finger protein 62 [Folsomia candida]